ncbi:MAG: hypothetical protein A3H44_00370 [Gammaproteobacteria bacterium RIFCSPLOWO2_02_FULL_57_10]|nr:MAG: hypothetical protein A3H44_00370 [Gammaproteobacteria bacterium RIFCSPLOWO2_02_FULL_57_10]
MIVGFLALLMGVGTKDRGTILKIFSGLSKGEELLHPVGAGPARDGVLRQRYRGQGPLPQG